MESLVGKTLSTASGKDFTILRRRKSRTFPFFETFYLYDISLGGHPFSIKCDEINNLITEKGVTFVFD